MGLIAFIALALAGFFAFHRWQEARPIGPEPWQLRHRAHREVSSMSVVQTTYPNRHGTLVQGQIVDTSNCDVDSVSLRGTDDLFFGMMARQSAVANSGDRDIDAGGGTNLMRGIAVMDERQAASVTGKFETGDIVPVLYRGDIAVKVSAAVANGNNVVAATAASGADATREEIGQLSTKGADTTHILVPGARFMTDAVAQALAVVRLSGLVQSS